MNVEKAFNERLSDYKLKDDLNEEYKTIDELRKRDSYYLKADKGNSVVILDKSDYIKRYEKVRNPLNKWTGENRSFKNKGSFSKDLFPCIQKPKSRNSKNSCSTEST